MSRRPCTSGFARYLTGVLMKKLKYKFQMSDHTVQSINPYSGQVIRSFQPLTKEETAASADRAREAFQAWRNVPIADRCGLLERASEVLLSRKSELAHTITAEMGKPISQSIAEIEKCAWVCRYYATEAPAHLAHTVIETDADRSYVRYDPLGTVLAVMPWNYPFWQVFRFAAPTLTAGNTALLKHASNVWQSGEAIESVFREAGYPDGVFRHLQIGSDQVETLLDHPAVKAVSLTGSGGAGSAVARAAGSRIKKSVLELGGNNALVVFDDADLEATLETCIQARFQNTGQSCIAGKRLLVHRQVADQFTASLVERVKALKSGDPEDPDTYIGVLAREDLARDLEEQYSESVEMGAQTACGGRREGAYFEPTVLTGVRPGMPAFDQETFGPLLAVSIFESEAEALELLGNSQFGLGASLFTRDTQRAERLVPMIEEGAVFINELVKSDPRLPFGGVKASGYGRELSSLGIREFVNAKTVFIAAPPGSDQPGKE